MSNSKEIYINQFKTMKGYCLALPEHERMMESKYRRDSLFRAEYIIKCNELNKKLELLDKGGLL